MILVTGAGGQLSSEFKTVLDSGRAVYASKNDLDITSKSDLLTFLKSNNIKTILNCAAYTQVDLAEDEPEKADLVNSTAVKNLVEVCEELGTYLVHFSTDYVFDGESTVPYIEDNSVNPQSVYGSSKLKGEKVILNSNINASVFRVSWLYSEYGNNFVKTMKKLTTEREALNVVFDQIGCPTYTFDVANFVKGNLNQILETKGTHVYHYSNEGICSWYDFTKEINEQLGNNCKISPIRSSAYPQKAKRPNYSVFDKTKIKETFKVEIPYWKESLKKCLQKLS